MIRVTHLRKTYGSVTAVDDLSFEVRPNETFGLLGPNGAGKTTTMHMLVGLLRPDSGEISIGGITDPTRPEVRRIMGIAPQVLSLYDDMTVRENLMFFGRLYGMHGRRLRGRVKAVLERGALTERAGSLVKTLSGGMQRRLQLACALLHEPQVLLLDEPTVGIDPQARHHILKDIEDLKRQGRTILLTTHYMEEAQQLCDRIAIMDQGRILVMDSLENLIQSHAGKVLVRAELEEPAPAETVLHSLACASGSEWRADNGRLRFETDEPLEAIRQLNAAGLAIRRISIDRPSLETVFLELTGRSLRD
ncbi:MAG TPA: ABC transporter ATP-binding protein [Phycisphaerae bacterium]|jgi:ABC-2 type transport system ATP-binding protein|nr:ABC transporter ATP-binding protein [Phycisphaerae bacterium]HOB76377.1 ABC transporter ATP-binding protein [Phycisphaerae bacterium]HOJ53511.1 ABC transporter ATP-binding protein [Phycisphaerae bacterium]HOL25332.1 ABC transporter ATP-binding protein [Phycisphaerae bacterium]HPU32171.1 ABC transporter ATP-binding protein [Phycisphaerae bacterium]